MAQSPTLYVYDLTCVCVITVKGKTKKAKRTCVVEPLQEGEELIDTTGRKWRLAKLLGQNEPELIYAGQRSNRPIFTLCHTTVKQAQLRMSVANDELLPGIIHLVSIRSSYISAHWIAGLDINFLRYLSFGTKFT